MPKKQKDKRTHRVVFYLTRAERNQVEAKRLKNICLRNINAAAYLALLNWLDQ